MNLQELNKDIVMHTGQCHSMTLTTQQVNKAFQKLGINAVIDFINWAETRDKPYQDFGFIAINA